MKKTINNKQLIGAQSILLLLFVCVASTTLLSGSERGKKSEDTTADAYTWLQFTRDDHVVLRCVVELDHLILKDKPDYTPFYYTDGVPRADFRSELTLRFDGSSYLKTSSGALMFPIKVWEAEIDRESFKTVRSYCGNNIVSWTLPDFTQDKIPRFYVLGDTGCKPKSQRCNVDVDKDNPDLKAYWALPDIVSQVQQSDFSFGIHVGDYVYQGENGVNKDTVKSLSKTAGWSEWKSDFFDPMAPLLNKVPWLMIRGNHETYWSNSGLGYWIFLDDRLQGDPDGLEGGEEQDVPALYSNIKLDRQIMRPPWSMPFSNRVTAIIVDTAWTNLYKSNLKLEDRLAQYGEEHFYQIEDMTRDPNKRYWLISHVPLLGLNEDGDTIKPAESGNKGSYEIIETVGKWVTRQGWLRQLDRSRGHQLFTAFEVYIAGDIHSLQHIKPKADYRYPTQVVVGSGGVFLDTLGTCSQRDDSELGICECQCKELNFSSIKDEDKHWEQELQVTGKAWQTFGYAIYDSDGMTYMMYKEKDDIFVSLGTFNIP